jgi:hypothetical protein
MSHAAKHTRKPPARRHAKKAPREYQHPIYGGRDYWPCHLSPGELEKLHSEIIQGRGNAVLANKEVERVAHNIAVALSDDAKPPEVREAVHEYAADLLRRLEVEADFVREPELTYALFPVACRRISRIPFIPDRAYIEALTGKDREVAMLAVRAGRPQ